MSDEAKNEGIVIDYKQLSNIFGVESLFLYEKSGVNLGAVYETVAAQELKAHGYELFYYDRKKIGEVDFLIDDYENMSIIPIEIKSGSNSRNFKALPKIIYELI